MLKLACLVILTLTALGCGAPKKTRVYNVKIRLANQESRKTLGAAQRSAEGAPEWEPFAEYDGKGVFTDHYGPFDLPNGSPCGVAWASENSHDAPRPQSGTTVSVLFGNVLRWHGDGSGTAVLPYSSGESIRVDSNQPWRLVLYRLSSNDTSTAPQVPPTTMDKTSVYDWERARSLASPTPAWGAGGRVTIRDPHANEPDFYAQCVVCGRRYSDYVTGQRCPVCGGKLVIGGRNASMSSNGSGPVSESAQEQRIPSVTDRGR